MAFTLEELDARIAARAAAPTDQSYTASLLARGTERCAQKLGEEATETVIAAVADRKDELAKEAGDVLYHLLVLLRASGVPLSEVMAELESRTARSGLAEKAARKPE